VFLLLIRPSYVTIVLPFLNLVPPSDPLDLSHSPWLWQRVSVVDGLFVLLERLSHVLHTSYCSAFSESCSSLWPLDLSHRPWLWQHVSMVDGLFGLLERLLLVLHCTSFSESFSSL
jgi:hypothetical protein